MDQVVFRNEIPPSDKGASLIVMTDDVINDGDTLIIPAKYFNAKAPKAYMYWKAYAEELQEGWYELKPLSNTALKHPIPAYTPMNIIPVLYKKFYQDE